MRRVKTVYIGFCALVNFDSESMQIFWIYQFRVISCARIQFNLLCGLEQFFSLFALIYLRMSSGSFLFFVH
jgi:hypothetical protein